MGVGTLGLYGRLVYACVSWETSLEKGDEYYTTVKCFKLAALRRQSDQTSRKTYGPGETRTQDHVFRGHLLYH